MTGLTNEEVFSELYFSKKAIKEVLGVTVRCWRPPYGDVDNRVRYIADKLDMRTVVWNQDTDDWNWSNVGMAAIRQNYQTIFNRQSAGNFNHSGTIVLTHELDNGTMSLVQEYLPQIQQQFVGGVMPVAMCLNNSRPYIEQEDYLYPNYEQWMSGTTSMSLAAPTAASIASLALSPTSVPTSSAAPSSATAAASGGAASSGARAVVSTSSRASGSHASSTASATHKSGARARLAAGSTAIVATIAVAAYLF
ncbi:hypothetical protein BMF94_6918 [Rhodotorula taiwanensis]|uniref:chitin deacetylase n=1 Tax=Rhodotorula taiwanensis TaxID=741276 RepID=A0A2S5AZW6_9BASI|nr:hypothetical protein BMF94_6918 [Rhodotorula taiwanensis]